MSRKIRKPSYLLHKASNRGRVVIDGKTTYLDGPFGSQESLDHYDRVCREWLLRQDVSRCRLTIDDLAILYCEHADRYYVKNNRPTSEPHNIRIALRPLVTLFGMTRAADFGPAHLRSGRPADDGRSRVGRPAHNFLHLGLTAFFTPKGNAVKHFRQLFFG